MEGSVELDITNDTFDRLVVWKGLVTDGVGGERRVLRDKFVSPFGALVMSPRLPHDAG